METLKLDLDIKDFQKVVSIVRNRCAVFNILDFVKPIGCRVFSTTKGYHIYLVTDGKDLNSFDICFLQMALGSDYKRETFNFMRFRDSLDKKWNVLFESKYDGQGNLLSHEVAEPVLSDVLWKAIQERVKA